MAPVPITTAEDMKDRVIDVIVEGGIILWTLQSGGTQTGEKTNE